MKFYILLAIAVSGLPTIAVTAEKQAPTKKEIRKALDITLRTQRRLSRVEDRQEKKHSLIAAIAKSDAHATRAVSDWAAGQESEPISR